MRCPNISSPEFKALKAKYGLKKAIYLYDQNGQDIPTLEEADKLLKNGNANDPLLNEALMSDDNELSNFIMDTLKKNYPGIKLFNSKKDFMEFVNKNNGDISKVSIDNIGHAFMNAIYINEENALQSTYFHENAHIYWDALPNDNPIKKALIKLFSNDFITGSEIEEAIIRNIGIAGVDIAKVQLRGNLLDRFKALLKQFWAQVKNKLGFASEKDLVNIMAQNIWNNKDKFTEKQFINHIVKNMNMNPYNIIQDDVTKAFKYGDKTFTSVTRAVGMFSVFNPDEAANAIYNRLLRQKEQNDDDNAGELDTFEKREEFIEMQKQKWNRQAKVGSAIHKVAELIVKGQNFEEIKESFFDGAGGEKIKDFFNEDILESTHAEIERVINSWKAKGWNVYSEITIGSVEHGVAGLADVILEKDNQLAVLDFKSFFEDDKSSKNTGRFLRFPLETMPDTKENKHQLQVDVLANMLERQENKDIKFTAIVPMIYEMEDGKVSKFEYDSKKVKVRNRKRRKSSIKDKGRKHGNIILNHVKKVTESREKLSEQNNLEKDENLPKDFSKELAKEQRELTIILSQMFGSLNDVPVEYVERILQVGLESMSNLMVDSLGYEYNDIFGNKSEGIAPMEAKEFFQRYFDRIRPDQEVKYEEYNKSDFINEIIGKQGIDFGTSDTDKAFKIYQAELKMLDEIFEDLQDIEGIQKMKVTKLNSIYKKVINMSSNEGKRFKEFLEDLKVAQLLTEKLKEENSEGYYGMKYATLYLGRTVRNPDRIFTDLQNYNWYQEWFKNIMNIDDQHVLVNILAAELYNEHRLAVRDVQNMKIELESYVYDTYSKKDKKDRKRLENNDFERVIYTDNTNGFRYFMTPSQAREELEKEYGKDDPRPGNMARYIYTLTEIMKQNDGRIKSISRTKQPRIMVPELQASSLDIFKELPLNKKHLYHKIHNLFSNKPYDSQTVRIKGEEKRFTDVKQKYYEIIQEKIKNDEDISNELDYIEGINNDLKKEHKKIGKKRKSKSVYVIGKQTGRTVLKSRNYNSSVQEYLASVMEAKRLERIIPISEYTMRMYNKLGNEGINMMDFLTKQIDKKVYKRVEDKLAKSEKTKSIVNKLIWWTATKTLGANVVSNIRNRFIGAFWNWVKYPEYMAESFKRRFSDFGGKRSLINKYDPFLSVDQYRKISGIMKNANMGTIMQDTTFNKYKSFWSKVNEKAFLPLELAELYNQGSLLRGVLTDKEMAAYNSKGTPLRIFEDEILDPDMDTSTWTEKARISFQNKLDKSKIHPDVIQGNRANEIAKILASVHGYFGFNKSQWSYQMIGRMFGMYTLSWAQAAFEIMYKPKRTDFTGRVEAGLFNSFMLNAKVMAYNLFLNSSIAEKERRKVHRMIWERNGFKTRKEAEIKLYKMDRFANPDEYIIKQKFNGETLYYIPGLHTNLNDFEKIIAEKIDFDNYKEGQKIKKEDIDAIDRKNMMKLFIYIALSVGGKIALNAIGGWDDELRKKEEYEIGGEKYKSEGVPLNQLTSSERFLHYLLKFSEGIFGSFVDDATFFVNSNFFMNFFRTPIPLATLGQFSRGMANLGRDKGIGNKDKSFYENPSLQHAYLSPKYQDQLMGQLPYLAKPYKDIKSLKRWFTDAEYKEMLDKRSTKYAEEFRMDVLKEAGAFLMMKNNELDYEELRKTVDQEFETLKNVYFEYIMYEDYTKSKYYEDSQYRKFMEWLDVVKKYENSTELERAREYSMSNKEIGKRIKEINEQINQ